MEILEHGVQRLARGGRRERQGVPNVAGAHATFYRVLLGMLEVISDPVDRGMRGGAEFFRRQVTGKRGIGHATSLDWGARNLQPLVPHGTLTVARAAIPSAPAGTLPAQSRSRRRSDYD